jgi:hypothetical protein
MFFLLFLPRRFETFILAGKAPLPDSTSPRPLPLNDAATPSARKHVPLMKVTLMS